MGRNRKPTSTIEPPYPFSADFIKHLKSLPAIYDKKDPNYTNAAVTKQAWIELGKKCNLKGTVVVFYLENVLFFKG